MTALGIGIIGCGVISDIYLKNARAFPQLDLRAVADLRPETAQQKAAAHGVEALSPADLLARDDIDVVLNLTVPAAHLEVGLAALAAGKHVYSEKPLAVSAADARKMADTAAGRGLRIGCAPDTFLGGAQQLVRALLDDGRIGTPVAGTATLMLPGHERWHPNPDFYYAGAGAGPLFDMGPYYITAMVNLLGPVRKVSAMASAARQSRVIATGPRQGQAVPVEAMTHVAGVLEFTCGALVQIVTSFDVRAHQHTPLELYGTEGSVLIPDPNRFDGSVSLFRQSEWQPQPATHAFGEGNHRGLGLAEMADAIIAGRPHRASGDLALHALDVIESLLVSAETGTARLVASTCARPDAMRPDGTFNPNTTEVA